MEYSLLQSLERLLKPIRSRLSNLVQRGIIHRLSDSKFQVSLGGGDTQENVRNSQHFGFASHPPKYSEVLLIFPGGVREVGFAISSRSQKGCPVELQEGESVQYNEDGSSITLKKGGKIEIKNQESELIAVICELASKVDAMSAYLVQTGTSPSGACTFVRPSVDLGSVIQKLKSFRS